MAECQDWKALDEKRKSSLCEVPISESWREMEDATLLVSTWQAIFASSLLPRFFLERRHKRMFLIEIPSSGSLSTCPLWSHAETKAWSQELNPSYPSRFQEPNLLSWELDPRYFDMECECLNHCPPPAWQVLSWLSSGVLSLLLPSCAQFSTWL